VLVHTLFQGPGEPNTFVRNLWLLASSFQARLPQLVERHLALAGTLWAEVYAAHVLRHVQVTVCEYMQGIQVGDAFIGPGLAAVDVPTFKTLMVVLQRGNFHISGEWIPMPPAFLESLTPTSAPTSRGMAASTRSSASATVSTLTGNTPTGRGGEVNTNATTSQQSFVANTARDAEFDALQLRPQMRELLCGRRATHRPFANANERGRLLAHVRAHLVMAPTAAAASGT
jgi:hypothetical protein